ncbi:hypothetical protein [Modestobacter sp. SYSU DS0511]
MSDAATGTHHTSSGAPADPFVVQVNWLLGATGGKEQLARRSGNRVSVRTLDNWTAGRYPRNKITGAVRDLDAWAVEHVPGYPGAGAPRLIESCGPAPAGAVAATPEPQPADQRTEPTTGKPRRAWLRWAAPLVAVLVIAVTTGGILLFRDEPLPTRGDGPAWPETTGRLGANTFADPVKLQDNAQPIPPDTTVQVRCRHNAPSIPSVEPDGYWYLIDSGEWAGRWSPANSFMNGDFPGRPTKHNTDMAVPICR